MSAFHDNALIGASGQQGYKISRSVRLRSSASAYFNRSAYPVASAGTQWTMSMWVKRGTLGVANDLFTFVSTTGSAQQAGIQFDSNNAIRWWQYAPSTYQFQKITTAVFRDPSAWYHLVFVYDTTLATAEDRCQVWINGVRQTSFSTNTNPSQNLVTYYKTGGLYPYLGAENRNASSALTPFDGYMTEVNFIDGQALTPSSFGETDSITGVWKPKKYAGTYGTNGFYLNFSDNSGATATTIGKDYSGNGNNWTPNNISVTAGATYDSMIDVPTPYADGNSGRGNYCVLSPIDTQSGVLSDGNMTVTTSASNYSPTRGTIAVSSGKWYWEVVIGSGTSTQIGICPTSEALTTAIGSTTGSYAYYSATGQKVNNNSYSTYGATYTTGDVIGHALDLDSGTLTFYKNNTSQGTAFTGLSGVFAPAVSDASTAGTNTITANFGQRPFSYTPPTGFVALNTQNLPTPTISNGAQYMAATLYTGNGSTQTINNSVNGVSFQPDFVWIKSRSNAYSHQLFDAVRGTGALLSDLTAAEQAYGDFTSYNSNGFTVSITGSIGVNNNGSTFVGWQWKESPSAGFDIVTCTTNGSGIITSTSHALGVTPSMILLKARTGTDAWYVYHKNSTATATQGTLQLNATAAVNTTNGSSGGVDKWTVSSSAFAAGNAAWSYQANTNHIAYLFSEVAGYSKFGSYTGSADGPFVYLGFRPRFVMVKRTDSAGNYWTIKDTARNTANIVNLQLYPNDPAAEATATFDLIDIVSNGFKLRGTSSDVNASGGTYIYAAFAENPFKLSLAR